MELYFLRHGLAGKSSQWQGSDFDRPLTADGKKRMQREAAAIRALNLSIDVIASSPLVRALQTAHIVAQQLKLLDRLMREELLSPGFGCEELKMILKKYADAQALMLVGHEPDFSTTISHIIGGGTIICKKGALALVDLQNPADLQGELVWLIPPKAMAA
jgi:phosphohistidine phosphatase